MTTLLSTVVPSHSPANIRVIFIRMQRRVPAGEWSSSRATKRFFTRSSCRPSRARRRQQGRHQLAELWRRYVWRRGADRRSEAQRTISMLTDGVLMRLNKQDLLMNELSCNGHRRGGPGGRRGWPVADVALRVPEPQDRGLDHIPLYFIRMSSVRSDRGTKYVVCCDTGRRSSGAFILGNAHAYVEGRLMATIRLAARADQPVLRSGSMTRLTSCTALSPDSAPARYVRFSSASARDPVAELHADSPCACPRALRCHPDHVMATGASSRP